MSFPQRVRSLRKAKRMTQGDLAKQVGVSTMAISKYECGKSFPSSVVLVKLAKALEVSVDSFFRPNAIEVANFSYRNGEKLSHSMLNFIEYKVKDEAQKWLQLREIFASQVSLPVYEPIDFLVENELSMEDVEDLALRVRDEWGLGFDPIYNLIGLLESKGILVKCVDLETKFAFEGVSAQADDIPIMVISKAWSTCRQRFTLAHELGHLLLNGKVPDTDLELYCNRFASAFLIPRDAIFQMIGERRKQVSFAELQILKEKYLISLQALVKRLSELLVISTRESQVLNKFIKESGWKVEEPGDQDMPVEKPQLVQQLVYRGVVEGVLSHSKAMELLHITALDLRQRLLGGEHLHARYAD